MEQVFIGCKLPNGLIMELVKPGLQLGQDGKLLPGIQPAPVGKRVTLAGANSVRGHDKSNPLNPGFGLTAVEKDFADQWFESNKDAAFITSGAVFRANSASAAAGMAKDRLTDKQAKTGMEPLDPVKDARMPAGVVGDKDQLRRLGVQA